MLLRATALAVSVAFALSPAFAQQGVKDNPARAKPKATEAKAAKTKDNKAKSKRTAQAPKQRHQCKVGPYEKQTRLVMETVRDKPVYIAYWSSDGPFHCSFETWPGDGRARWVDSKNGMVINLISGTMRIERNGDKYLIHARDVDRMPYCGTFGLISGVLTVPVQKKAHCNWKELPSSEPAAGQEAAPAEVEPAVSPQEAHAASHADAG